MTIASPWWQTLWFWAFCLLGFAALLGVIYQLRLRQVTRGFERQLEARVSERTRIARELHDTLLQSFQGLLLRFQTVANRLPRGPIRQNLEDAIEEGSGAIAEGRQAIQELRSSSSSHSGTLEMAFNTLGQTLAAAPCEAPVPSIEVDVRGTTRVLHPLVRDEIYRIGAEALRNAYKHAKARRIEVEVRYEDRHLILAVRDDGVGTDLQLLNRGQVSGHFGLHGMRERSGILNAQLEVWTEKGSGTEVELSVPGHVAYTGLRRRPGILALKMFDGKPQRRQSDGA
jgi:signal transduction histidine kinase